MPETPKLDDRGELDLTRIIEEQTNHIIILERHLEEAKEKIESLKKQVQFLQDKIRDHRWKK